MKTRTLLVLAVVCGLAILVAGGAQLLRVAGRDAPERPLDVGRTAQVGDATVTVTAVETHDRSLTVTLRVGGVEDPNGGGGFTLVTDAPVRPADNGCLAFTQAERECRVRFDDLSERTRARVLVYARVDERARWDLTTAGVTP